ESGERVAVATVPRSLQDQLRERDVPAVLAALGAELPYAVLKGKQSYLCPRALELLDADAAEDDDDDDDETHLDDLHAAHEPQARGREMGESLREWAARDPS